MQTLPDPIPAAAFKQLETDLRAAVAKVAAQLPEPLTDAERDALKARTLGPESLPFCEDAGRLMSQFPQLMPRTLTDDLIAEYPMRLQQFSDLTTLVDIIRTLTRAFQDARLLVGNHVRNVADDAYNAARRDDGTTAEAQPILQRMAAQRAHRKDPKPE